MIRAPQSPTAQAEPEKAGVFNAVAQNMQVGLMICGRLVKPTHVFSQASSYTRSLSGLQTTRRPNNIVNFKSVSTNSVLLKTEANDVVNGPRAQGLGGNWGEAKVVHASEKMGDPALLVALLEKDNI